MRIVWDAGDPHRRFHLRLAGFESGARVLAMTYSHPRIELAVAADERHLILLRGRLENAIDGSLHSMQKIGRDVLQNAVADDHVELSGSKGQHAGVRNATEVDSSVPISHSVQTRQLDPAFLPQLGMSTGLSGRRVEG